MGANQTRAMTMHGGVCIVVDANVEIIQKRIEKEYCDVLAEIPGRGHPPGRGTPAANRPWASGCVGNAANLFPQALEGWQPDIVTEMCPCHDPLSYIAEGYTPEQAERCPAEDRLATWPRPGSR